ncbi:MAG TPA: CHASE3 domain-containing protein [Bryobacteraceae bacterium]|nr:CHASE3 domain-containing protein [Bryobacteraceae bacterium]
MTSPGRTGRVAAYVANLSLGTKGVLVVAIPVCALLAAMAVFYQFQRQTRQAASSVEQSFEIRAEIRRVLTLLVNAETGTRGYLLTQRDAFLEPYLAARKELPGPIGALRQLIQDNPSQMARLSRVETLIAATMQALDDLRRDVAANRTEAGVGRLDSAKGSMDSLRSELSDMQDEEQQLLEQHIQAERQAQRRLEMAIFSGGLLGLLGGIAAALIFTKGIARRIRHLEEHAYRVAAGVPIVEEASGNDEIGRLERTLKQTSELLARQSEELRLAHSQLETRVEQRTAELSEANEELRQANEVRQAVIQSSPVAIWAVNLEGLVTFWNPSAERIFGWTETEVIGKPLPIVPAGQQEEYREWLARFREGETMAAVERTRLKKDGSSIEVAIWTAPLRDAGGRISGTIAIDSDVTERKVLEEQFRQSQKLEAIGRLAGGVAHDFNNLLTVITGYSEMLVAEAQNEPNVLEFGQEIQSASSRAAALTAQLLAFSRRQISQPRILDLNEVVSHSMKLLRRVIGEDIAIQTHLDMGLGRVKADPIHIDQVIMNLVVNARDAMVHGGKLTIETANQTLDAEYVGRHIGVEPGPYCMLAVSDTGTGMDAATRSRLFEPFFTTKEAGKGTGLGLSIVYGVVKQNGGEIMVYSELGKGTTFKIYLPMAVVPAEFATTEERPSEMRGSETVLLCEDEPAIRKLVHSMLTKYGYRVIEVESPDDALRLARQDGEHIHLLLTDIVMPQMSGFDLAHAIREIRPQVKVLYMSGYTDNQVSRSWVLDPGTPFIQKPFTGVALTQKVREALGNSAAAS